MIKEKPKKMPVGYIVLWGIFALAYAVWMAFFMKTTVLVSYETLAQRTVDGIEHTDITGMIGAHWLYPVWAVLSFLCLLLFPLYIKKFLFSGENTKSGKIFCLINLIAGCGFITWYGFLKDPSLYTASMIGLDFPWEFRMWGVLASLSVFTNTLYMYNKFGYYSRPGLICGSIGSAAIFVTVNVPSAGEELVPTVRCISHWAGALIFAFFCAAPMVIFLFSKTRKKDKRFTILFLAFAAILAAMIILLVTVGKDGIIESLPMWAAYIVLFLANFTKLFEPKKLTEKEVATV